VLAGGRDGRSGGYAQDPWLLRVIIDPLHSLAASEELAFDIQTHLGGKTSVLSCEERGSSGPSFRWGSP